MEREIKVSVIIPVYNVETYISKCISSVIEQNYKNIEIILIDDGSQDSSGKILDEYEKKDEAIEYNINYSQKLKINTQADEAFDIYLGRDIDGLVKSVNDVLDIETQITQVKSMMEEERYRDEASQSTLNSMLEGLNKQYDLAKQNMTDSFENGIKQMKSYQQKNSVAKGDVGNRETRLTLTKSRVTEQKTNFKSLKSNNEDIDLEEVVIGYSSAELVYNASLSAASKVVQQTLLDFIR